MAAAPPHHHRHITLNEQVQNMCESIRTVIGEFKPSVAIICGSGLGGLKELVEEKYTIPYEEIAGFPRSTVQGHAGKLLFGKLGDKDVVCMLGRIHPYEGYPTARAALPVRIMKGLGAKVLIATAATGAVNPDMEIGDIVLIKDHINSAVLGLQSPLVGPNDDSVGPRFPSMVNMYTPKLIKLAEECAKELGVEKHIKTGVYFFAGGPSYETIAEARAYRILGADVCGMSLTQETTVARYLGMDILGIAIVTNKICTDYDKTFHANHEEVLAISDKRSKEIQSIVQKVVSKLEC